VYVEAANQLLIEADDAVTVVVDIASGRVDVFSPAMTPARRWLISHPLFTLPLIELLKRHGLYSVHAAALSVRGWGVLLAGSTGAGKSTLSIALLRAGCEFLGDDIVFLRPTASGVRVLGFPDEIDLAEPTSMLFPELGEIFRRPKHPGWPKWSVQADELYSAATVLECEPAALLITRVASSIESRLAPIRADEALIELAPNVLLTDAGAAAAHFAALGQLARGCPAYRLDAGRDFDSLATRLRDLLGA
jgi:hypothetical protein